ncbi:MAG TPA: formate dehydrogenase accessory sulfurtransferase FdhD [Pyrinomonadaceae bacterium]|nr:formate dehydrogenase accessory sulfurtransferase FdhD [Pyrinomonadaceae bacterium]
MKKESNFTEIPVYRVKNNCKVMVETDALAVEEPLEIRLGFIENGKATHKNISITMRTPGDDFELAAGFLFTEGIIKLAAQINRIGHCGVPRKDSNLRNTVRVDLRSDVIIDFKRLERHFYTSSSCGVCGKTSIEALQTGVCRLKETAKPIFTAETINRLPETLRTAQNVFDRTGGLHAAALFDSAGKMDSLREDVGRHNAVDKLVGTQFLAGKTPVSDKLLLVSGRASFELVQKALMAGIPILAAVGAPSSLSVELAREYGMTLLGFVRDNRFNIYTGAERINESAIFSREKVESNKFIKAKASIMAGQ